MRDTRKNYSMGEGGAVLINNAYKGCTNLSCCFPQTKLVRVIKGRVFDVAVDLRKVNHIYGARRAGDLAECYANADKALKIFGWKTEKSLEDMCRDSWNWQKQNPNGYRV